MQINQGATPKFEGIKRVEVQDLAYVVARANEGASEPGGLRAATEKLDKDIFKQLDKQRTDRNAHEFILGRESKLASYKYTAAYQGLIRSQVHHGLTSLVTTYPDIIILTNQDARKFWENKYENQVRLDRAMTRLKGEAVDETNRISELYAKVDAALEEARPTLEPLDQRQKELNDSKPTGFLPFVFKHGQHKNWKTEQKKLDAEMQKALKPFKAVQKELLEEQEKLKEHGGPLSFFWDLEAYYKAHQKADAESGKRAESITLYSANQLEEKLNPPQK